MSDGILRIYPSGFLGNASLKSTAAIDSEINTKQQFNVSRITTPNAYAGSLEMTSIWGCVRANMPEVKTFEFHERVLRFACEVFGTNYLYDWIQAQKQSECYDEYHSRWIDETLKYIFLGQGREFSCDNWVGLLASKQADVGNADSPVVRSLFVDTRRINTSYSIKDLIVEWLARPGGFEDLTSSLYVLFGSR